MNWLDKLSALIRVSENTKTFFKTLTSVIGMVIAIVSTRNFVVANKLTTLERIQQFIFVSDNRIEMQKLLREIGSKNKANRAFFMFYEQIPNGQFVSVFKEYYQWQPEGQVQIFDAKYPITKGADTDRKKKLERGECSKIFVEEYPDDDGLAIALRKSNVTFQIVCPVIDVKIEGKKRIGVLGLEFEARPDNRSSIEANLLEGAVDVAASFD